MKNFINLKKNKKKKIINYHELDDIRLLVFGEFKALEDRHDDHLVLNGSAQQPGDFFVRRNADINPSVLIFQFSEKRNKIVKTLV